MIEHVLNPNDLLQLLSDVLNKDGKVIGQTPNFNDFTFKIFKQTWGPLHQLPY